MQNPAVKKTSVTGSKSHYLSKVNRLKYNIIVSHVLARQKPTARILAVKSYNQLNTDISHCSLRSQNVISDPVVWEEMGQ